MMKRQHKLGFLILGLVMLLAVLIRPVQANMVALGAPQSLGQGTARSYAAMGDRGQISELGVILSASALNGLPTERSEIDLALPQEAMRTTPFTHIGLNWNPQGHLPPPIYGTPHFDLHFYTISQAERQQITAIGDDKAKVYKMPDASLIPAGYVMAPDSAVPGEGSHWVNPQSREFQGAPHGFDHTFVYGFYNGKMNFLEPMISRAALEQYQTFDEAIARPARYSTSSAHPGRYSVSYDAQTQEFRIALKDFVR